jgi:hypothetical protein
MTEPKYTHLGWLSFCPVYVGDIHGRSPEVVARREWLQPVLRWAIALQRISIATCSSFFPDWSPTWHIRITGKIT